MSTSEKVKIAAILAIMFLSVYVSTSVGDAWYYPVMFGLNFGLAFKLGRMKHTIDLGPHLMGMSILASICGILLPLSMLWQK